MTKIIQILIGIFLIFCVNQTLAQPDPGVDYHYYKSALVHKSKKDFKAAVVDFNIFLKYNPDHKMAIYFRGYCHLYQQNYTLAIKDFKKLMQLDPNSIDGSFSAAKSYYQQGDYDKAIKYYAKSLQLDEFHIPSYNDLGMSYCALNRFDEALNVFYKAIQVDSSFAMAYCNAGAARYFNQDQENPTTRDLKIAKEWFTKAIKKDDGLYLAYYNRAAVNYFLGSYEESLDDLNYAILLQPKNPMNYFYAGVIYNETGNKNRAISEFNKALKLSPNLPFPYEMLGDIHKDIGNFEQAIDFYLKAAAANYPIGESYAGLMHYRIASVHALANEEEDMYTSLRRAKDLKLFEYRKAYNDFVQAKDFKPYRSKEKLRKFTLDISKAKKTGNFLDTSLRWFRMRQGTYDYKQGRK